MQAIKKIVKHVYFQNFITVVILLASVLVGLETYPDLLHAHAKLFHGLDAIIQVIFTLEIILRILSYKKPLHFFSSAQNLFDFAITAVFYLPFGGAYVSVLRLVRIFRIFRLFTAFPQLQLMVGALIKSVPSMGYVSLLLFIQFYMFAVIGTVLFGKADPANFASLGQSLLTLFQVVTLEGWVELYKGVGATPSATIYFITFIITGTMVILNLFIGVIMNGFDEVKEQMEKEISEETGELEDELQDIARQLTDLRKKLTKQTKRRR